MNNMSINEFYNEEKINELQNKLSCADIIKYNFKNIINSNLMRHLKIREIDHNKAEVIFRFVINNDNNFIEIDERYIELEYIFRKDVEQKKLFFNQYDYDKGMVWDYITFFNILILDLNNKFLEIIYKINNKDTILEHINYLIKNAEISLREIGMLSWK